MVTIRTAILVAGNFALESRSDACSPCLSIRLVTFPLRCTDNPLGSTLVPADRFSNYFPRPENRRLAKVAMARVHVLSLSVMIPIATRGGGVSRKSLLVVCENIDRE